MDMQSSLERLANDFQIGCKAGASLQFLVNQNYVELTGLLRTHKHKGPLTINKLAIQLGVNKNSLKTAISRYVAPHKIYQHTASAKIKDSDIPFFETNKNLAEEINSLDSTLTHLPSINFTGSPILGADLELVFSKKDFQLNFQNKVSRLCFKTEKENFLYFDAEPIDESSVITRIIKFDKQNNIFK